MYHFGELEVGEQLPKTCRSLLTICLLGTEVCKGIRFGVVSASIPSLASSGEPSNSGTVLRLERGGIEESLSLASMSNAELSSDTTQAFCLTPLRFVLRFLWDSWAAGTTVTTGQSVPVSVPIITVIYDVSSWGLCHHLFRPLRCLLCHS